MDIDKVKRDKLELLALVGMGFFLLFDEDDEVVATKKQRQGGAIGRVQKHDRAHSGFVPLGCFALIACLFLYSRCVMINERLQSHAFVQSKSIFFLFKLISCAMPLGMGASIWK